MACLPYNEGVKPEIIHQLIDLNHQFYQTFSGAFSQTRARVQPGVRRAMAGIPPYGNWLDVGCGNGSVARAWAADQRTGLYYGVDFSEGLLNEARSLQEAVPPGLEVKFGLADLTHPEWSQSLSDFHWDGALALAVLHHIPGAEVRLNLLREIASLLPKGARFIISVWQFTTSPRWLARVLPWETVGVSADDVETGDTLLDWRASLPGQPEQVGYRYVHAFTPAELASLAEQAGFKVIETYESDGANGRLGLYGVWKRK